MHELSIARALARSVEEHAPPDARVRAVRLRIGALPSIDPDALDVAWTAVTAGGRLGGSRLEPRFQQWTLTCPDCGATWPSREPYESCGCGCTTPLPSGGNELLLESIDVE